MQSLFKEIRTLFLFSSLICFSGLEALPNGCQVISGDAQVNANSNTVTIESGNRTILHWDNFSIDSGEVTRFLQTDKHSAILNRVIGGSESTIYGSLESNGKVYLINPQGILIGPGARVETAGFLASTLDILNEDFLADKALSFSGSSTAWVRNLGTIACATGDITLIARFVSNEGDLTASEGSVSLIAAPEVLLQVEGREKFLIRPEGKEIQTLAEELQQGSNPYIQAIKNAGTIKALSTTEENGRVYLVAAKGSAGISGSLVAKQGDKGGEIRVLGDQVFIQEGTLIDVSGEKGGGTVLIGGDYQGNNPDICNAQTTWVDKDTTINADALVEGDGGKVILWGDQATSFCGTISTRGGEVSGDGGLVEVSGKYLDFQGFADRSAPQGKFGTLLLDPVNFTISGVTSANVTPPVLSGSYTVTGCVANTIDAGALGVLLGTGSVIIDTSCSGSSGCGLTGTITVSNPIAWATATTLTLIANQTININANITNTSVAQNFTALECIAAQGSVTAGNAKGIVVTAATITTHAGDIYFQGTGGDAGSNNYGIELNGATLRSITVPGTGNGNITLIGQCSPDNAAPVDKNIGVYIHGVPPVVVDNIATTGITTILGTCVPNSTGLSNAGVHITDNVSINSTASGGDILIRGVGGGGSTDNYGIDIHDNAFVSSSKNITLIGQGNGTGSNSVGVLLENFVTVQTTGTGSILLDGTGGAGTDGNSGVKTDTSVTIQLIDGNIDIIGKGNGTGSSNIGVDILTSNIQATGIGNVLIEGTGTAAGTFGNSGVHLVGANISLTNGNTNIIGHGRGTGIDNIGIVSDSGTQILTGIGSIFIEGVGGFGTDNNSGASFFSSALISGTGNINVVGQGNGTGSTNTGVTISNISTFQANGGNILIEGIGGDGIDVNRGVKIVLNSTVTASLGNIAVTGVGQGTGSVNDGVIMETGGQISATGGPGSSNNIHVDGRASSQTGSLGLGIGLAQGALITSNNQDIIVRAESLTGMALFMSESSIVSSGVQFIDLVSRGFTSSAGGDTLIQAGSMISSLGQIHFNGSNQLIIDATGGSGSTGIMIPAVGGAFVGNIGDILVLRGGNSPNESAVIANRGGPTTITVGRDLILTGGTGTKAFAQIGDTTGSGDILFPFIGGDTLLRGNNSYAVIGYGNTVSNGTNITGKITLQRSVGDLSLLASVNPGDVEGFAQIGHLSPLVGAPDLSGDIFIDAVNGAPGQNVTLLGGVTSGSYAQIGHGVPSAVFVSSATFNNSTAITVFAGNSIIMAGGVSAATGTYIVNPTPMNSFLTTFPRSGSITLVTDNNNPLNPFLGAAGISMNANSSITNNALSGAQVRIYTVSQGLNSIPLGQSINGFAFTPTLTPGFNTAYENFGIYDGSGDFIGPEFAIYYKTPNNACTLCPSARTPVTPQQNTLAVDTAQISDLLANLIAKTGITTLYHGQVCTRFLAAQQGSVESYTENAESQDCEPGFWRFESFVFENNVDRIDIYFP